jgi:hypothetical protein
MPTDDAAPIEQDHGSAREVYANFGLAMYMANVLESGMANALMLLEWRPAIKLPISRMEYTLQHDARLAAYRKLSMGQLLSKIRALPKFPSSLTDSLERCVQARNVLTHHYFWERAGDLMLQPGRLRMIAECEEYRDLFHAVDERLDEETKKALEAIGVTDSVIDEMREELIAEARRCYENTTPET